MGWGGGGGVWQPCIMYVCATVPGRTSAGHHQEAGKHLLGILRKGKDGKEQVGACLGSKC